MERSFGNPSVDSTTDLLLLRNTCCQQQGHPLGELFRGAVSASDVMGPQVTAPTEANDPDVAVWNNFRDWINVL